MPEQITAPALDLTPTERAIDAMRAQLAAAPYPLTGPEWLLLDALDESEAEVARLRERLADEERLHGSTIDDRDHFHEMADKLAYAVAPEEVIGEHSSMNCPWENALDLITPMAEVDKLREENRAYEKALAPDGRAA